MRTRKLMRRTGAVLMAAPLTVGLLVTAPAAAQDEPEAKPVEVEASALYASPITDAIPNTLTNQFPPQLFCVLQPQFCNEDSQEIREAVSGIIKGVDEGAQPEPVQPVPPDSLAVAFAGGNTRYQSAVKFDLPEVPADRQVDRFVVTFVQGHPSYSVDSPAFRQAVAAAVAAAATRDPAVFMDSFTKALAEAPLSEPVIGIEACPLTKPFEPIDAPQAGSDEDIPSNEVDGKPEPAVDCLYGTNGSFDLEAGTWSFDLTFAFEAWNDGTIENHGLLLRPTGAPNLAFGDPDTSTNAQIVLDYAEAPKATLATSEPPPPFGPFEPAPQPEPAAEPAPAAPSTSGTGTSTISSPPSTGMFNAPAPTPLSTGDDLPAAPEVAPGSDAGGMPPVALDDTGVPAAVPGSLPYLWLLLPVFLGGAYLLAKSLTEDLPVATARAGALTRLLEARNPTTA
jgi:hypothetical protein